MTVLSKTRIIGAFTAVMLLIALSATSVSAQRTDSYNPQKAARIDVCFLLDSTGSMGDEISVVKEKIWEIVNDILLGEPRPDVRFSIVTYRDIHDEYVVKVFPFTRDVDRVHADLKQIIATGGGDKRENVNEGFRQAVHELDWDDSQGVSRMIFLIGDAGPHMEYEQTIPYNDTAKIASKKGIQVFSIGCSGIDHLEINEFTEIASLTGGVFEFLTYKMDIEQDGEKKTLLITGDDASIAEPGALSDSDWMRGAEELKSMGKVRSAGVKEKLVVKDEISGEEREMDACEMSGSYNTQFMENNLDTVIRRQIQIQAEMQGAKYDESELTVKVTDEITKKTETKEQKKSWFRSFIEWIKSIF